MSLGIPLGTLRKPRLAQSTRKLYLEVPLALTHSCLQFVMSRSWLEPRTTCSRTRNTMWRKIIISFNPLQHPIWHYFSCFLLSSWFYVWEYADIILCGVVDICCCLCVCEVCSFSLRCSIDHVLFVVGARLLVFWSIISSLLKGKE